MNRALKTIEVKDFQDSQLGDGCFVRPSEGLCVVRTKHLLAVPGATWMSTCPAHTALSLLVVGMAIKLRQVRL